MDHKTRALAHIALLTHDIETARYIEERRQYRDRTCGAISLAFMLNIITDEEADQLEARAILATTLQAA